MINGRKTGFFVNGSLAAMPIEKTCETLQNIGYDALELHAFYLDGFADDDALTALRRKVEKSGMILSECIVQQDYVTHTREEHDHAVEETGRYMQRCAAAGIQTINLFTGPRPWMPNRVIVGEHVTMGQAWDMVFDAFDTLTPLAESLHVTLAVENVWGMVCHDFFTMHHLISRYNSPFLGVNFDPSHDQLAGNTDMEFLIRQWGIQNIKHIHMKDAAGTQTRGNVLFPPLGAGLVDWGGFVRGLDAIGYDGVLSVEYEADQYLSRYRGGDWVCAAEESFAALQSILG